MTRNQIDGLFFIPPIKPIPRPLDLTYSFFDKIKILNNESMVYVQSGPLSIINILESHGYSIKFFDFNHFKSKATLEETIEFLIKEYNPKTVLAYSYTASIPGLKKCLRLFKSKNRDIISIVGGPHVTFLDIETFKDFRKSLDFIVRGEGEKTILELFNRLFKNNNFEDINGLTYRKNGKIKKNQNRKLMTSKELNELPNIDLKSYPKNELKKLIYFSINISRGCPYKCTFCSNHQFWERKLRFKSIDKIIEDIVYLDNKFNIYYDFGDSNLPINKKIFEELIIKFQKEIIPKDNLGMILIRSNLIENERLDLIKKFIRDYKSAYITVGLENASPNILKIMNKPNWNIQLEALKKIKNYQIKSIPTWIVGHPGENSHTMARNILMLNKLNQEKIIDSSILFMYTPLPGTAPFHEKEKFGLIIHHYKWEYYDRAIFPPPYSLKDTKTDQITLTSEQIWNYWLLMVETQRKWRKILIKKANEMIHYNEFVKFINNDPIYSQINPAEGIINCYKDFL
ncbi:MAG: radical SAM protein [Candidatus Lokiarchaeota archaeon]|nr:radical SAM protein [Candidatus Lokiarchaeota archaeon]